MAGPKNRAERRAAKARAAESDLQAVGVPSREAMLRYIAENPDRSGKREIAKAFKLKGADRVALKEMLRELEQEGLLEKRAKRMITPGALPHVTVLDIITRDGDGALIAVPSERSDDGLTPRVRIRTHRTSERSAGGAAGVGDRVLARVFPADGDDTVAYTGRVMKVFDKVRHRVLGVVRASDDGFRLEPTERKQPELRITKDGLNGAKPGDLVEIEPGAAPRMGLAVGRVIQVLGDFTSEKAISTIALHAHDIPHVFAQAVLDAADAAKPADMTDREDWRDLPLITIDPADAKDHDDAVFAEPDADPANVGGMVVTVAIADVSWYVRSGSALDREALKRGNSVYFPDRVVPMLPERISNDLCSLREDVDRPALAVRMRFDSHGHKLNHRFHRIMMRSHAKLSYTEAQAAIDGEPNAKTTPILDRILRPLWSAYGLLKQARDKRQPLELDLPERKIALDDQGQVKDVIVPPRLDAHRLIEEMMIQANVAAAESLEDRKAAVIYRSHDGPALAKQESLREFLKTLDIPLARGAQMRPSMFNRILEQVRGTDNDILVNQVVLRSQSQAEYSTDNIGHFGLNLRRYAHFTSPIRRYADLIVHRSLVQSLNLGAGGLADGEREQLTEVAGLISTAERRAMAAERDTVDRLIAYHLASRINQVFDGRVAGVNKAGLFISLPQYGADGFVPVSTIGDDYYHFDEARFALVGDRSGTGYQLGDSVSVRLIEAIPLAGSMRFELLSEPKSLPGQTRSFHKSKMGRRPGKSGPLGSRPRGKRQ
jgi:ribonuclease R